MGNPDIAKLVASHLRELERLRERVLPVRVGRAVQDAVRGNFRAGSFHGAEPWKDPLRKKLGFHGAEGGYGPLLSGANHLMSSTDYHPLPGRVVIRNNAEYAAAHNEGATIKVTQKMRRFFWARHYKQRQLRGDGSPEAEFWKRMALKRPGADIAIPRRRFLGPSPAVGRLVRSVVARELEAFCRRMSTKR